MNFPGRRPKAARFVYDQGDSMFVVQVRPDGKVDLGIRQKAFGGGILATATLEAPELTVLISKLFDALVNVNARIAKLRDDK